MILDQFRGGHNQSFVVWLSQLEALFARHEVPRERWAAEVKRGMAENVLKILSNVEEDLTRLLGNPYIWTFHMMKVALIGNEKQVEESRPLEKKLGDFRRDHPTACKVAAGALIGAAAIPLAPAVLVGALNVVGFTSGGVAAGSLATWLQSTFYGGYVASGSLFAMAQSAAAGGVAVTSASGIVAGAGAAGARAALEFTKPTDAPDDDAWDVKI